MDNTDVGLTALEYQIPHLPKGVRNENLAPLLA